MTKSYTTPEDFVTDESFVSYCFHHDEKDVLYWENRIKEHPEQQENIEQACLLIESLSVKPTYERKLKEWEKLKKQIEIQRNKESAHKKSDNNWKRIWWIAAAVLLLLISTGLVIRLLNSTAAEPLIYQTGVGESMQITLPDKTKVWLNAESKLIYQKKFEQSDKRAVTLIGEAFFDVRKDAERPFVIHANSLNIEVLGTTFNVRAYPHSATTSTTLISGAIQVSLTQQPEKTFRLQPKEKFTITNNKYKQVENDDNLQKSIKNQSKISALKPVFMLTKVEKDPLLNNNQPLETAWIKGKLAFRNKNFKELALQLNHKFGVQFHFEMDTLKKYQFTGIFTTETLSEVLNALQLTSPTHPFSYKIEGNNVYIMEINTHHQSLNH